MLHISLIFPDVHRVFDLLISPCPEVFFTVPQVKALAGEIKSSGGELSIKGRALAAAVLCWQFATVSDSRNLQVSQYIFGHSGLEGRN